MARDGVSFKVDGFKDLDHALKDLGNSQGKQVVRRTLKQLGNPIAEEAKDLAPIDNTRDDGPHLYEQIAVSSSLDPQHRRRLAKSKGTIDVFVGPGKNAFHAHLQEFGTEHHAAQPFMRPAWDAHKARLMDRLKDLLWLNIQRRLRLNAKAAARAARKGN
jgi:HK97 gp10 family phage protein